MFKKLTTACLALVALATLAIPASASAASPALTTAGGALYTGAVKAVNVGFTKFTSEAGGPTVECSNDLLEGNVITNAGAGGAIVGEVTSAFFKGIEAGERCSSNLGSVTVKTGNPDGPVENGTPWCMTAEPGAAMELKVRGGKCSEGARKITFVLEFHSIMTVSCKYERTAPVVGAYNTSPEDAKGTVAGGEGTTFTGEAGNSGTCPTSGTLDMTFELQTNTGGTLTIS
jgi:hypothetical protein